MKNTGNKKIWFTHHELLETIAIVQAVKYGAAKQCNKAEVKITNSLLNKLLDFDIDSRGTVVELDYMTRCTLWNYVEQYIGFCAETKQHIEYALAVTISTKLSG